MPFLINGRAHSFGRAPLRKLPEICTRVGREKKRKRIGLFIKDKFNENERKGGDVINCEIFKLNF